MKIDIRSFCLWQAPLISYALRTEDKPENRTKPRKALYNSGLLSPTPSKSSGVRLAEGDKVVWRFKATGNNTGPFMGGRATGKSIAVTGTITFRLENSRMAEAWLNLDVLVLLQQVGVIPVAA